MVSRHTTLVVLASFTLWSRGWAQTGSSQPDTTPAPAYGQVNPAVMTAENPPISAVDSASLEPNLQPRSMLVGGIVGSESLDTNVNDNLTTSSSVHSVTRLLGGVTMQRLWSRYNFAAAYVGGVGFYPNVDPLVRNIQELQAQQSISWKTGQATVRDSFSYLPDGSFGAGSFGGASGFQLGLGGLGESSGMPGLSLGGHYGILGSAQYGSLGQSPRITNVALADVVQELSPRSAVTVAGSFGVVHFTGANPFGFINSTQVGAEVGYSHSISRRDQLGIVYGYRAFRYPSGIGASGIDSNILQVLYGHRISGRMDFVAGAGPQWTKILDPVAGNSNRVSASARVSLRYRFARTSTALSYHRLDTTGSGFFAGAESDIVRASATHEIARRWHASVDVGFSHNRRLQNATQGINAASFNYVFAGGGVEREFNRNFGAFVSYQYNQQVLNDLVCARGVACNNTSSRQVVTFGASWHFRPIRLD